MLELKKFTFEEDDFRNECGLGVTFIDPDLQNVDYTRRNAVLMSRYGKRYTPKEVAIALRHLAMWCERLEGDTVPF